MAKHQIKATITDRKNRVLSSAQNDYGKTHPLQHRFACLVGQPARIFLHAEIAALVKLKKEDKPFKIKVERYHKNGNPANAKPCSVCEAAIKQYGINHVEYTI